MKKLIFTMSLIILGFAGFSQLTISDAQLFGSTRNAFGTKINFDSVTTNIVQKEFTIQNNNKVDIVITSVEIPEGFGVVVVNKVIKPNSVGKIIVLCYRDYIKNEGAFVDDLILNTEYQNIDSKVTTQQKINLIGFIK